MKTIRPIEWISIDGKSQKEVKGKLRILDQTRLPEDVVWLELANVKDIWHAIKTLQVRGAPAIGVAAAFGIVVAAQNVKRSYSLSKMYDAVLDAAEYLATSRPTAVNLFWAIERMQKKAEAMLKEDVEPEEFLQGLLSEAIKINEEDIAMCRAIGKYGATLIKDNYTILTHCNAGALATSEYGTALAPIYTAHSLGKRVKVFADETRPLLQGSRLTAWELLQAGIEVTVICDNTAAQVMREGKINCVFVGADRIAANGDAANKIGTYSVAVLAKHHKIPFYVFAPSSTFDLKIRSGDLIPIEQRSADEVIFGFGKRTAPEGVQVYSPAFDVTPASLITAIVCEKGIIHPPFSKNIRKLIKG